MSWTELHVFIVTVAVPGAIAAVFLLASWRPWKKADPVQRGYWGGALGFTAAYVVGHLLNMGRVPSVPPTLVQDWLPLVALGAGVVGFATSLKRVPALAGVVGTALVSMAASGAIIADLAESMRPALGVSVGVVAGAGLLAAASVWFFGDLADRAKGFAPPAVLWVALAGTSYLFMMHKAAFAMHLSGVLASACAVAALLAWWRPGVSIAHGAVHVVLVTFAGMCLVATLFAELPWWVGLAAFVSPQAAWVGDLPFVRSRRPWVRALVRIIAVAAAIGTVVALGRPAPDPMYDLYQGY